MTFAIHRRAFGTMALAAGLPATLRAQGAWPDRPVRLVVPFGAGGAVDTLSRSVANAFPQNANVAVISALAGIGLERTTIALVADPGARMNRHSIVAEGDFGRMAIRLDNRPLATNPKSSEMTALSLVRMIEARLGGLVI